MREAISQESVKVWSAECVVWSCEKENSRFNIQYSGFIYTLALFLFPLVFYSLAFGAEEAVHGGEWKEWLWKAVNFAILVFVLVKFLGKPLKAFLKQRTELIEKSLKEAKEAKELAEKALADIENKLSLKDREVEEILAQARQVAKKEQDALVLQGEHMKDKILEQAKNNINYELKLARDSIKAEVIEVSLELAEKKIKEKLSGDRQAQLLEESLVRIEGRN